MRIGFSNIYAWRPHVEHMHYLAELSRDAGHEVRFLTCDADVGSCYSKEMRPSRSPIAHCARCIIGGIRSYEAKNVSSIGQLAGPGIQYPAESAEWSLSSASTLGRFESDQDFESDEFKSIAKRLDGSILKAYNAARRWIDKERLDAICVFNGRIDMTRSVLEAARDAKIPFVSVERTWFGDGLQILPDESCVGLKSIHIMMRHWRNMPLTDVQSRKAAGHVASRFLRQNKKEWRAYNVAAQVKDWPVKGPRYRILLLPGSRNEIWGHPDWVSAWPEVTEAYDALMDHLGLSANDVVLRCHPNWGELIGVVDGVKAERYYTEWAKRRGIRFISSADQTSTLGLIEMSDAIVVGGGSAALEAAFIGKQVIAISPSVYHEAGFQSDACSPDTLRHLLLNVNLDDISRKKQSEYIARQALRFSFTMNYRIPQFVQQVRCITTTRYEYYEGADIDRLPTLLRTGILKADDYSYAQDTNEEDEVLSMIADRHWQALFEMQLPLLNTMRRKISRRWLLRPIDGLRNAIPRGDM